MKNDNLKIFLTVFDIFLVSYLLCILSHLLFLILQSVMPEYAAVDDQIPHTF